MRISSLERKTKETDISVRLCLDGTGNVSVDTGIGFFDHMLTAFAVHSGMDLELTCKGDLGVDCHHTIEDVGIVLGKAFAAAIGENKSVKRYGSSFIPMDDALAQAVIDISGRGYLVFDCPFTFATMGDMETQMVREFFYAFAINSGITLHIRLLYGENDHHKCEAVFKAFAHAIGEASCKRDSVLSTKGVL